MMTLALLMISLIGNSGRLDAHTMRKGRGNEPLRLEQLQTIKEHKYASRGSSISERYLQKFWCSLVPYIPKCIAPNTLTLTGLIMNSVSVLILLYYSPDLKSEVSLSIEGTDSRCHRGRLCSLLCVFSYTKLLMLWMANMLVKLTRSLPLGNYSITAVMRLLRVGLCITILINPSFCSSVLVRHSGNRNASSCSVHSILHIYCALLYGSLAVLYNWISGVREVSVAQLFPPSGSM